MRHTLIELGHAQPRSHAQPPTKIKTDNSTADGIGNGTIKPNRSKSMDMRFFWLCCRVNQGQFKIYWAPGAHNFADYFTTHHSPAHHKQLRPFYLHEATSLSDVQGCIRAMGAPSGHIHVTTLCTSGRCQPTTTVAFPRCTYSSYQSSHKSNKTATLLPDSHVHLIS